MKSVFKMAIVGLMSVAMHANALQQELVQTTESVVSAVAKSKVGRQFLEKSLGVSAASSAAEINKVLAAMSPAARIAAVGAMNAYATKAKNGTSIADQMSNEEAAKQAFMTGGKLLSVTAAAQSGTSTSAVAAKSEGQCDFTLDLAKSDVRGAPNFSTRKAIVKAGLLSKGNCQENPDTDLTDDQKVTLWNLAEYQLNAGLNQDSPDELRIKVGAEYISKVQGVSMEDAVQRLTNINTKCSWNAQKNGRMAAAAAAAL